LESELILQNVILLLGRVNFQNFIDTKNYSENDILKKLSRVQVSNLTQIAEYDYFKQNAE
jgi:hypothetical protein